MACMVAVFPRRQLANRPLANIDLYPPVCSFDDVLDRLICQLNTFLEHRVSAFLARARVHVTKVGIVVEPAIDRPSCRLISPLGDFGDIAPFRDLLTKGLGPFRAEPGGAPYYRSALGPCWHLPNLFSAASSATSCNLRSAQGATDDNKQSAHAESSLET